MCDADGDAAEQNSHYLVYPRSNGIVLCPQRWTFKEVITTMFKWFLMEITAQKVVDAFYEVKFTKSKGHLRILE